MTGPDAESDVIAGPEVTVRVTFTYRCTVPLARQILCRSLSDIPFDSNAGQPSLLGGLAGGWFKRLQSEATLLIHDAPYEYARKES